MIQLSPRLRSLAARKRVCPECLSHPLRIEPAPIPREDAAFEVCDGCGYFHIVEDPHVKPPPEPRGRIIQADFGARR